MTYPVYTGIPDDDRRIARELQAMGAFDQPASEQPIVKDSSLLRNIAEFITWMRWKGEVNVYGCRVGAEYARRQEAVSYA